MAEADAHVREPHPLLVRFISHQAMSGGRALDVACGFRFLNRRLGPLLQAALRPGGWLLYQTHNLRKLTPGSDFPAEYLLAIGELPRTFSAWEIFQVGDDGGSSRDESWIVCRKPDPPEVTEQVMKGQWLADVSEL